MKSEKEAVYKIPLIGRCTLGNRANVLMSAYGHTIYLRRALQAYTCQHIVIDASEKKDSEQKPNQQTCNARLQVYCAKAPARLSRNRFTPTTLGSVGTHVSVCSL